MTTYQTIVYGEPLRFCADFAQASSPIRVDVYGEWLSTQFQVANARHEPAHALRLILEDGPDGHDEAEILAAIGRLTEEEERCKNL